MDSKPIHVFARVMTIYQLIVRGSCIYLVGRLVVVMQLLVLHCSFPSNTGIYTRLNHFLYLHSSTDARLDISYQHLILVNFRTDH